MNLSASTVSEGASAAYTFTATLVGGTSQGDTTVVTDKGTIVIHDGQSSGTLVLGSNGEDVYLDASSLTATITSASGGNFEQLNVGTASATAAIGDTINTTTVTLSNVIVNQDSGMATVWANLDHAPLTSLVLTLSNGATITFGTGYVAGTDVASTPFAVPEHTTTFSVASTNAGGNFENLAYTSTATLTVTDTLVIGSAAGDQLGSPDLYTLPTSSHGAISGDAGKDILIGDPGGSTLRAGTTANIVLVLDTSGSMGSSNISFTNSSGSVVNETRLQAMINSVDATLNQLHNSGATVLVHIDQFSTNASSVGTFDVSTDGGLASALSAVNALKATNSTNYEAGLQSALTWINSTGAGAPIASASVNKLVFISDGQPNELNNNAAGGTETSTAVSATAAQAIAAALGTLSASGSIKLDHVSEVAAIGAAHYDLQAIGIQVGSTLGTASNPSALGFLSELEGYNYGSVTTGHTADNITTANELSSAIGALTGSQTIQDVAGNDVINGGAGNDIIFGDSVNTDALAIAHNLGTPAGAGALVFHELGWTSAQIVDFITTNLATATPTVQLESGRTGGDDVINGGAGNDIIFGQEGSDIISGGAGSDILNGGTGSNTFAWTLGDQGTTASLAADVITDFKLTPVSSGGDVLNLKDLLVGEHDGTGANAINLSQFLHFSEVGGKAVLSIDHNGTSDGATFAADQTITFNNVSLSQLTTALGAATTDADIIAKMIATGHLKTDV